MTYKSKYMQSKAATEQTSGFKSSYMQNKAAAKQQNNMAASPSEGGGVVAAQRSLDQIKTELTAAQSAEKSAMGKIDEYMLTYSGALDLRDPAELETLKNTATAATKERERLEQEYNAHSGSYEDKFGGMGDVGKAVTSVIGKPFLAVDALAESAKNAAQGKEMDMDSLAMQRYAQIGKLREDALSETSGAGHLLAETGLSIADNLYSRLLSAGTSGGALLSMGVSSAADKAHELGEQGESATRSLVRGAVSGGIEAATEKLPLDTLADLVKTGGKGVIKNLLKQGGVEASEEGVAYALNWAADKLAKDPNAKWDWNEFAASVAGGGLSGLFFGLGGTAVNRVNSGAMPGSGLDGAPTARDGTLPFDTKLAEENTKAKILPVEDPVAATEGQKNTAPAQAEAEYRAEKPQNVEYPTVPIINLSMQGVADLNGGELPQSGNALRTAAIGRTRTRLGLDQNSAVYIPASNVMRNGEEYVLKITRSSLNKMLSPSNGGVVAPESIAVLENIERIANNGVYFKSEGDRQNRDQIAGYDHLLTTVYIDNQPYVVDMRVRVYDDPSGGENRLYYFTPEEIVTTKKVGANFPTGTLHERTMSQETAPTSTFNVPQAVPGVKNQYMQDGARVFTKQAARASGEMPLDENWRERVADKGLLPGAQLAQQTLQGAEGVTDEGYWASIMEEHRAPFSETDVDGYMESLLDAVDQRFNRATPKDASVTEEYEPTNKGKKTKWDNKRPSEIKEVKEIVDDPEVSGSKSITSNLAQALSSAGIDYNKDLARNLDAAAGGKNTPLRAKLRDLIERPFNAAGEIYSTNVKSKLDDLKSTMDGLGIKKGSKESAAVQRYGEGRYQDETGEVHEYTEAMLREEFPSTWQNIVKAAQYCRQVYDSYVDRINAVLEQIYPDPVSRAQEEADYHTGKASQYAQMAEEQQRTLNELHRRLDEHKAQLAKTREGTQHYANLQNTIHRIEMQMEGVQKKVDKRRGDADTHNAKAAAVQARIASGEVLRNKRLMKRADYFHHFNEMEKGWAGLINILTTPADIDSGLVGVSENTKPKSKWAGFLQGRKGGAYTEDAVGGLLAYIPMAEQKIAYDPVIAENRNIIKTLAQETEETCNANRFIEWMTDWTNDLAGKTNPYDRTMQKDWSRKTVAVAKWLSSRAKSNAVVGNVRSATAQVFNLPNALVYIKSPKAWKSGATIYAKAVAGDQTAKSLLAESGFLNQRYLDDAFSQFDEGLLKKPEKLANWMLTVGDKGVAKLIWASAYEQGRAQGVTDPVEYADDITRRSIAGRGIGEVPIKQKAAKTQLLSPFQIEVANTWQLQKEALKEKNLGGLFAMYVLTFLMNTVTRELLGYDVGFDPINAIIDGVQDWDEEETAVSNLMGIAGRLGGEILSARPGGAQLAMIAVSDDYTREKLFGDADPTRYGVGNIGLDALVDTGASAINAIRDHDASKLDLMTPLTNFLLPYGGKQVGRLVEGAQDLGLLPGATKEGIARQPDAGSMTDSGGLRFAVDEKNPFDVAKLLALGPFSTKGGMEYLEEGYSALGESQTSAAMEAAKMGVDLVDYMAAYRGMSKAEKDAEKRAVIQNMDLTDEEKAYIYRYAMLSSDAKEKERTVFDSLVGGGSDAGLIGSTLMSMKDAEKQEGKLQAIGAAGVSEQEAKELFGMVMGTNLKTDQGNATAYAKLLDAMNTALGVQEVVELKNAGANFDNFLGYTGAGMDAGSAYDLSMAAVDMRNQEMIEGTFNLKENARWIESANLSKNEQEIAWLISYPEWAEKADKAGVSNWDYITYKKATYGLTKKFDKLKALRDAGYTATEAAQIYDKIN